MVTHVMSDGTRRDSIAGFVVPAGHPIYRILKTDIQKRKESLADAVNSKELISGEKNEKNVMCQ